MTTTTKRAKRSAAQLPKEPAYLWVPVTLLVEQDIIVVLQQDARILGIMQKEGMWYLRILNPETRERREESYRPGQFVYTKSSESVKSRLEQWQNAEKGENP